MSIVRVKSVVATTAVLALLAACGGGGGGMSSGYGGGGGGGMQQMGFIDKALVADTSALQTSTSAATLDANLKNPWGIAFGPGLPVWVANQVTSTTTLYDGNGAVQKAYSGAPAAITVATASPTGAVYNGSIGGAGAFVVAGSPAQFIYATLSGTIEGWNLTTAATTKTAYTAPGGTAYTGLAIGQDGTGNNWTLYAADFANGKVDMLDKAFNLVTPAGAFATPAGVPAGYVPYGIQNIASSGSAAAQIAVAYAKQGPAGAVAGAGNGYVAVFDNMGANGKLLISAGPLNAPWGMALAPNGFGSFGGALLVGNLGDGTINAFNVSTGASMGALKSPSGTTLALSGLWGIAFGNGAASQPTSTLFYTAGANSQADGIYGSIVYGSSSSGGGGGGGGGY
jgi:uncharacterized protein (TIGR03118 family)